MLTSMILDMLLQFEGFIFCGCTSTLYSKAGPCYGERSLEFSFLHVLPRFCYLWGFALCNIHSLIDPSNIIRNTPTKYDVLATDS